MPDAGRRRPYPEPAHVDTGGRHSAARRHRVTGWGLIGPGCAVVAIIVLAIVNRSSGPSTPDLPASFGPGSDCYYVMTPTETANLEKQGKCRSGAVAAQAPQSWVVRYYPFYNSSWYKNSIVPPAAQAEYSGQMSSFGTENATEIAKEAPTAQYVDGNGDTVTGTDAGVSGDGTSISDDSGGSDGGGGDGGGDHGGGFDGGGFHGGD